MNKKASKKQTAKKPAATPRVRTAATTTPKNSCFSPWSLSVYVYWFIILFFIAATFYILGRSHGIATIKSAENNVEITEEALAQGSDYYNAAREKLMAGNLDDAIVDLTASVDAGYGADALILRGEAYMQSGDYRAALNDFNAVLELNANNSVAYYDRALLYTRLEDYASALNDINNALAANAITPDDKLQLRDLYARRGQLNLWLKNWNGAIADFTNSLARPEGVVSPDVYAERAEAYTAIGAYQAAIDDYASAVRVVAEQIQGATTAADRERLSSNAMGYFEKSAALNLSIGDKDSARTDLESAYTIAVALNSEDTMNRLQGLIMNLDM